MNNKGVLFTVLCLSIILSLGFLILFFKDLDFFLTQKENPGEILSISKQGDEYNIKLKYYNDYLKNEIITVVQLNSTSYRSDIEKLPKIVIVHYSNFFPNSIYIMDLRVPKQGILLVDLLLNFISVISIKACFVKLKIKTYAHKNINGTA